MAAAEWRQSVSILMNWRTGFEERSQQRFGPKRAASRVVAHSSPTARRPSKAVVGPQGRRESPPRVFSVEKFLSMSGMGIHADTNYTVKVFAESVSFGSSSQSDPAVIDYLFPSM